MRAVIYGEDEAAAVASQPERGGALTWKERGQERVCFLEFGNLSAKLEVALKTAPEEVHSLFKKDGAATVLRDALVISREKALLSTLKGSASCTSCPSP